MRIFKGGAALAGAAMLLATASAAHAADPIQFQGYAQGCFGVGCTPAVTGAAAGGTFNYTGASAYTVGGVGQFNGFATYNPFSDTYNLSVQAAVGNFGQFTAAANTPNFSDAFALKVFFSLPTAPDQLFSATVLGTAASAFGGGVDVTYDPNSTEFAFSTADGREGTAKLTISSPTNVQLGSAAFQTGNIAATVTPEPASMLLLGSGLFGLAGLARRRRKNSAESAE